MNMTFLSSIIAEISAFASTAVHALLAWRYWQQGERQRPFVLMSVQAAILLAFAVGYVFIILMPDKQPLISSHFFRPAIVLLFTVTALVSLATYDYHRSQERLLGEKLTERERELTLQQMSRQQAERERLMDQYLKQVTDNLGHELKTPVSVILGYTNMIQSGAFGELDTALVAPVNRIDGNARRIQIISQRTVALLAGQFTAVPVRLHEAVEDTIEQPCLWAATRKRPGDVTFAVGGTAVIEAEIDLIRVALFELIHNAVKFSESGGEIQIVIGPHEYNGGATAVTVIDQGIGIDRRFHQRIFEPGFQVEMQASRRYEGTGTGLYVVAHVAKRHGGFVEVESEPGKGSLFRLVLPSE